MSKPNRGKNTGGQRPANMATGNVEKAIEQPGKVEPWPDLPEPGKAISMERWQQAQTAERGFHTMNYTEGLLHYAASYKNYFHYVGLGNHLHGLHVIEVGPADFPALSQVTGEGKAIIVEPMPSENLERICKERGIVLINAPFEEIEEWEIPEGTIEVWLFNVMQHIIDPDKFIEKAKSIADRIRFFEPIDQPITDYHPHTYSLTDYQNYFGDCVQLYTGGNIPGFHEADCAYGVWIK